MFNKLSIIPNIIFKVAFKKLIFENIRAKKLYLRLAKFLANNGFDPPLPICSWRSERAWAGQDFNCKFPNINDYIICKDSTDRLFEEVLPLLNKDANILEIGCSVGRHLNYLFKKGYRNLTGVDISPKAISAMDIYFPEMSKIAKKIVGNAAKVIKRFDSKSYDLVFCHGVLVNISSTHNYIFKEMCRICRGYIVILENEGSFTAYPRDFQKMFERHNFKMISFKFLCRDNEGELLTLPKHVTDKNIFKNSTIRIFVEQI